MATTKAVTLPTITRAEIHDYTVLRARYDLAAKGLLALKKEVDMEEELLIERIEGGVPLAPNAARAYSVAVDNKPQRHPKWKEIFVEECGQAKADEKLAACEPVDHKKLVVNPRG